LSVRAHRRVSLLIARDERLGGRVSRGPPSRRSRYCEV
jgi:hypothetical protein